MRKAVLLGAVLVTLALVTVPDASAFEVRPACDVSQIKQNPEAVLENVLGEVHVVWSNGSYVSKDLVKISIIGVYTVPIAYREVQGPIMCVAAIAEQEWALWTVQVTDYSPVQWGWYPKQAGE